MNLKKEKKMFKKILLIFIIILLFSQISQAKNLGNDINTDEYPQDSKVLPEVTVNPDYVISGSVEKNVDMTLDNCIKLALGNNPQISAAFQDIFERDELAHPNIEAVGLYLRVAALADGDARQLHLREHLFLRIAAFAAQGLYVFADIEVGAELLHIRVISLLRNF